jgi:hypothetical protein
MRVWVVGLLHAAERMREVHVDFDEKVGEVHEGFVGDVHRGADGEDSLVGCGEVHEEPHALGNVSVCAR